MLFGLDPVSFCAGSITTGVLVCVAFFICAAFGSYKHRW